jgi:glycosyltransferase involved in cell wall biosynthesis
MITQARTKPRISVLMSVYNGARYLEASLVSILNQSFGDFEFIIVDDGSTDNSVEIIKNFSDPRINLIQMSHGGLVRALNKGMEICIEEFVARMDADDIAAPERFKIQVDYLDAHPNIDMVFGDIMTIDDDGSITGSQTMIGLNNEMLLESLLFQRIIKPVIHPTLMMRRRVVERLKRYRDFPSAEDHDFWFRCIDHFQIRRINQFLLKYRIHEGGVSRLKATQQAVYGCMSAVNYLVSSATGIDLLEERPELFARVTAGINNRVEKEIIPAALKFRLARLQIRNGQRVAAMGNLMTGLFRHGPLMLPSVLESRLKSLVRNTTDRVVSEIN